MSRFAINTPYLIIVVCLIIAILGVVSVVQMPVDMFPADEHSGGRRGDVLCGHAAGANRRRHHLSPGAILHARQRHRSHRIAIAERRKHHSRLLSIQHQCRYRRGDHRQSGGLGHEGPAARHAAAGRAQVRRVEPSGLPGHDERRRHDRRQSEGHRAELRSKPTGQRSRRVHPAAVWRAVAADPVLRRSVQAGSPADQPDGRGAVAESGQRDSSGRRRADREPRLQHLFQRAVQSEGRESISASR